MPPDGAEESIAAAILDTSLGMVDERTLAAARRAESIRSLLDVMVKGKCFDVFYLRYRLIRYDVQQ